MIRDGYDTSSRFITIDVVQDIAMDVLTASEIISKRRWPNSLALRRFSMNTVAGKDIAQGAVSSTELANLDSIQLGVDWPRSTNRRKS